MSPRPRPIRPAPQPPPDRRGIRSLQAGCAARLFRWLRGSLPLQSLRLKRLSRLEIHEVTTGSVTRALSTGIGNERTRPQKGRQAW